MHQDQEQLLQYNSRIQSQKYPRAKGKTALKKYNFADIGRRGAQHAHVTSIN